MPKISRATVAKLKPGAAERFVWDSELRGFGVRVLPSGVSSYVLQYRPRSGGRQRRFGIARLGELTPDEARIKAKRLLGQIADGADPSGERQSRRKAETVEELGERYLSDHAEAHKRESSIASDRRLLNALILPRLGRIKVADLSSDDVARLHHGLRETPYQANRALALVSKMLNLAEAWKLRPVNSNPCRHVKRYRETKRERFLSGDELRRIGAALAEAERDGSEPASCIAVIRLLALTGCRMGEIRTLRWEHVDMAASALRLPDSKTGAKVIALGAPALALLAALPRAGDYIAPGADAERPVSFNRLEKAWARIRDRAAVPDARLHDFRHTVGTYGGQAGFNAFLVRDLLGHKTLAMTGRYVEKDADPLKRAADAVSARIAAAMEGKSADVVPLPGPGRAA